MRLAHQVTSVGPYRIEYLDCYCITVLVTHHQHALKGPNFSHSKTRVSRDCQSSLVKLSYSYIKLQVWVLIEYITWIATAITVLVTHQQYALNRSNFSHSKTRVSRDCQSSLVKLSYSYIKLQLRFLIECNAYDFCCNHSAGNTSPACLKWSNFSHSKTRVSRDCQSSLVKLSYSYIKLQVWVLIECNTYDCCCNHSAGNTSPACLKWSNLSDSKNRVSRDCQSSLVTLGYSYIKLQVWVLIEYSTYDCCCNHSAGNTSPACFKRI